MVRWLASFILLSIPCAVDAQSEKQGVRVYGIVVDSVTRIGIPDVHVSSQRYGTITEADGSFMINVSDGEVLFFTHINYRSTCVRFSQPVADTVITVSMQEQVHVLRAVTVSDILSEEGIRTRILETERKISCEEQNANDNSKIINSLGKIAPLAAPTREERFFQQLLGPQDVTILSTNPNRGIFKMIRNLTNPEEPQIYRPRTRYRSDPSKINPFNVRLHAPDSTRRDTTGVVFIRD